MVRTVILTESTQEKLSKNGWSFSDFIDNSSLDFKHNKYNQAKYYYPGGNLIMTKSDDGIIANWIADELI